MNFKSFYGSKKASIFFLVKRASEQERDQSDIFNRLIET